MVSNELALELKSVLKLKRNGTDTYVPSEQIVRFIFEKCDTEEMRTLMQLIYFSGIPITEAIKILNDFDPTRMYYENGIAYYDIDWARGSKKEFKAFTPAEFAKQLKPIYVGEDAAPKYFRDRGLGLKYGRNFFIDKCVKAGIQDSFIKYMVRHSNGSVLMTNYLDKLNKLHSLL